MCAIGTDKEPLYQSLGDALALVGYTPVRIKLIDWVLDCPRWQELKTRRMFYDELANARITAGDEFCEAYGENDAFAMISILRIIEERRRASGSRRMAFILDSLKRPDEASRLREVYGPNFLLLGAYQPKEQRLLRITEKVCSSHHGIDQARFRADAETLILRDEREHGRDFGQHVQKTFPECDVFFDVSDCERLRSAVHRFVETLFGHPLRTPTLDEYAMSQAFVASLRSSAARQVGACAVDENGEIVALGANEAPRAFGGQRWTGDDGGGTRRDLKGPVDSNTAMIDGIVADLFKRLLHHGWIADTVPKSQTGDPEASLLKEAKEQRILKPVVGSDWRDSLSQRARVEQVIEYGNVVHAEMAAIVSAARRGVSVQGATLYTTTFPCHECARHIVAAGIRRVVFVEPYPKSRAEDLYHDSVAVDARNPGTRVPFEAYVGIAPRAYSRLFVAKRENKDGERLIWGEMDQLQKRPRGACELQRYVADEENYAKMFWAEALAKELGPEERLQSLGERFTNARKADRPSASEALDRTPSSRPPHSPAGADR